MPDILDEIDAFLSGGKAAPSSSVVDEIDAFMSGERSDPDTKPIPVADPRELEPLTMGDTSMRTVGDMRMASPEQTAAMFDEFERPQRERAAMMKSIGADEPSIVDEITNFLTAPIRGAASGIRQQFRGIEAATPGEAPFSKSMADGIADFMAEYLPGDPTQEGDIADTIGEAAGTSAPIIAQGLVGGVPGMVAGGALMQGGGAYEEALAATGDKATAKFVGRLNMPLGAIEGLFGGERAALKLLSKIDDLSGGTITRTIKGMAKDVGVGALAESGESVIQQAGSELIAKKVYDSDRKFADILVNIGKAAMIGGATGGLINAVASGIVRYKARRRGSRADRTATPDMASTFIADNPDAAQAIAGASTAPSRSDVPFLPSAAERSRLQSMIRSQLSAPKAEMRPIPVVPASEQGPLTLAEKSDEEIVQGQSEVDAQGQEVVSETPQAAQGTAVLESGPTAQAEPVPANTGQPKRSIYNHAAIERKMDAIVREHGDMISGDDTAGPQDPDAMGGEEGMSVRSHWVFRDTPEGKAAAKELRNQLPPEWKRLATHITTSKTGKAEDIRYNIGDQAMIDGLIRWHKRNSPTASRNTVAEFIDRYQKMFQPHQVYIAKQWLAMRDMPKGEKVKLEKEPQIIEADQLGVGDKVKVASVPFEVAEIDPDTGVARLKDHGENLEVAQGGQLAIDPGSLEQQTRDAEFTAPTGPTGLFGQETFEAHTGSQQQMALGNENAIGNAPQVGGAEAKIRKRYDPNATTKLFPESKAAQARKDFGDALDEFGKYLEGRQFTGAIFDPEIYKMAAKIVARGIDAGIKTFAEFVQNVASKIGRDRANRLMPALREEWKKAKGTYTDIDDPGDVDLSAVAEPSKPDIRPDLANPAQGTHGQQVVESVDAARNLAGEPQRRADVLVQQLADEKLNANYAAERKNVLDVAKEGRDLSDVETVAAKRIIFKESNDALASGNEQALIDAMTFINAYRQTGTEQGRAFRQRQNFGETSEQHTERLLQEAILTPPEKSTPQQWAAQIPAVKEELKAIGVDVADLATAAKNPVLAAQALGKINAIKSPRSDKFFEYWRNAILSGPKTQAANILGNAGNTVWDMTAQRFTEAAINTFARRKDDATFGEFRHMLRGALPGISRGAQNFLSAWKSEVPSFDVQMGRQSGTEITPNIAIKGKAGRFIRVPQRALLAVDEFAKSMIWEMQVAAHAYRIAKSEGLSGDAMATRIQELSMDTESIASQRAYDDALRLTFQERTGKLIQYALAARKDVPAIRYLMPFVTTPVNILKTGLRKSPLGSLPLAAKIIKAAQTGDYSGITPRIAEQVLAWAVMAAFLGNDPDDPWITGAASELDKRTRDFSRRQGTPPPQSIRIGDTWVSYARIEPAATAISMMVDIVDAWKKGGAGGVATKPLESVLGQLDSKTFLRGMGDLINAVRDRNLESVAQWGSNFATSWVPNLIRSGARSLRDEVPERSVWGRGEDWRERFTKRLVQKTETGVIPDQTKYDVWGRPLEYGKGPIPGTDWLYRMLVPLDLKMKKPFAGDIALLNWNNAHEDEDWFPSTPQKYTTKGGKQTYMSDEQYAEYSRVAGEIARRKVQAYFDGSPDPHNPTANDIKVMKKLMTSAREEARYRVLKKAS